MKYINKNIIKIVIFLSFTIIFTLFITYSLFIKHRIYNKNKLKKELLKKEEIYNFEEEKFENYKKTKKLFSSEDKINFYEIIEYKNLNYIWLDFYTILDNYKLSNVKLDIGHNDLFSNCKNGLVYKNTSKISCVGEYQNIINLIQNINSMSKFIVINDINLSNIKENIFKLNLNIHIFSFLGAEYE